MLAKDANEERAFPVTIGQTDEDLQGMSHMDWFGISEEEMSSADELACEPAFPNHGNVVFGPSPGMTLRQLASLKILQGLVANPNVIGPDPRKGWEIINCDESGLANYAVELADHLIERLA